jgi:DNA-directed RNA polymerase specialized sigma24 family protein
MKWQSSNEDAKDLTQGFFAMAIEKNYFASYDSTKASFQTFLRTCLDGFVVNQKKSDQRLKRGGGVAHFSLDFVGAERELAEHGIANGLNPEDFFHREWVRSLFALAIETLRQRYREKNKQIHFRLFEAYDLRDDDLPRPTYAELAKEFSLSKTTVTNYLAAARRDFRKTLLDKLREITATEEEYRQEARILLGIKG